MAIKPRAGESDEGGHRPGEWNAMCGGQRARGIRTGAPGAGMRPSAFGGLALGFVLLVSLAAGSFGCSGSKPVRAFRAARYYAEGTRALERGEAHVATVALERAAGLMPDASEIQNHLGLAYWSEGRSDAALRALARAVELDCENEAARGNLARLRAERGAEIDGSGSHGG